MPPLPGPKPGKEGPFTLNEDVSDSRVVGGELEGLLLEGATLFHLGSDQQRNQQQARESASGHSQDNPWALQIIGDRGVPGGLYLLRSGGSCGKVVGAGPSSRRRLFLLPLGRLVKPHSLLANKRFHSKHFGIQPLSANSASLTPPT